MAATNMQEINNFSSFRRESKRKGSCGYSSRHVSSAGVTPPSFISVERFESQLKEDEVIHLFPNLTNHRNLENGMKKAVWLLGVLVLSLGAAGGRGVAACQQPIGNPNNEIISDTFDNSLGGGSSNSNGVIDGQLSTDNINVNSISMSGSDSGNNNDNDNINGGEISGSTPFGSGSGLPLANRNEKQPGLLCPDIFPVSFYMIKSLDFFSSITDWLARYLYLWVMSSIDCNLKFSGSFA